MTSEQSWSTSDRRKCPYRQSASIAVAGSRRAADLGRRRIQWFAVVIVVFRGAFQDRVGERCDMRVDAPQVADDAQKIAIVENGGSSVGSAHAALQRTYVQSRRFRLLAA